MMTPRTGNRGVAADFRSQSTFRVAVAGAMLPERKAWLANAVLLAIVIPMSWNGLNHALTARVVATLLAVSVFSAIFVRIISEQQKRLQALAVTDPLTGAFNRTLLERVLDEAVQQHDRSGAAMTLIALDLDHFKAINDSLGHDAGDTVLVEIGALLRRRVRRADKVFRLGGEEFLVFLYGTGAEQAATVAESLRAEIAAHRFLDDRAVTASFGVATLQADENWTAWLKRCDRTLYRAKAAGRNRVAT